MDKPLSDLSQSELKAYRYIRNQLVHSNHAPSVREVMKHLGSSSPRSAEIAINRLVDRGYLRRRSDTKKLQLVSDLLNSREGANTVRLPLVGNVAAGVPILAEENIEAYISVDERLLKSSKSYRHFLLRVHGNSMDLRGIKNRDLVIVRQQQTADKGQNVVALIDDGATVKEYLPGPESIVLKPHSSDSSIQPIILQEDFQVQGIVVGTISNDQL